MIKIEKLYKYRPFDEHTFPMLENNQLFLCAAENLDDETECDVSLDYNNLIEFQQNGFKRECIDQIMQFVKPYTTEENFDELRSCMFGLMDLNGMIRSNFVLELAPELQRLAPGVDIAPIINWIRNIPEKLDDPKIKPQIENIIALSLSAKKLMGICSLSESNMNEYMWKNYANNETGYCIEYDLTDYEYNQSLFKVIYERKEKRQTNLMMSIVGSFIGTMIKGISNNQIQADDTHVLRLFLTKYDIWSYQKEWRILGDANSLIPAPKVKCIYLGKNISQENKNKMLEYCKINNIKYDFI